MGVYLGLDQSLSNTGFALVNTDKKNVHYGVIKTSARKADVERWAEIEQFIQTIVFTRANINHAYMESYYVCSPRAKAAVALISVNVILRRLFHELGIGVTYISANPKHQQSWRSILGLKTKEAPMVAYGIANSHAADAVAIGFAGVILDKIVTIDDIRLYSYLQWNTLPTVA